MSRPTSSSASGRRWSPPTRGLPPSSRSRPSPRATASGWPGCSTTSRSCCVASARPSAASRPTSSRRRFGRSSTTLAPDPRHPVHRTGYRPMIELLRTSKPTTSGCSSAPAAVATSSASSVSEMYGIPRERVIGSGPTAEYPRRRHRPDGRRRAADRRRPRQACPYLVADRSSAVVRRRQLRRRHRDARVGALRAARPSRRRRTGVRLRHAAPSVPWPRQPRAAGRCASIKDDFATVFEAVPVAS